MKRMVEIVGGGVAGLALGIGLRRGGVPVTLFEAGSYPRHRTCGEFIHGLDRGTIDLLDLGHTLSKSQPGDRVSWFGRARQPRRWRLAEPALVVSRRELDARLAEVFVGAGGRLETASSQPIGTIESGRVFASGRRPDSGSPWVAFKLHYGNLALDGDLEMHVGRRAYVGLCALPGGRANVCGIFRREHGVRSRPRLGIGGHLRATGMERLADRLDVAEPSPESFCSVAGLRFGRQAMDPGAVTVGDAYAVVPPYTGQGMAMALQGAGAAVPPLLAWSRGELKWPEAAREVDRLLARRFNRRLRRAARLHPLLLTNPGAALADVLQRGGVVSIRRLSAWLL